MFCAWISILLALIESVAGIAQTQQRLRSSAFAVPGNATYDYVVVGGGTAGLVIASRLAKIASVGVVEAGGFYEQDNGNYSTVPYGSLQMPLVYSSEDYPKQPLIDWDLFSVPQVNAGNRRIHYARGKTLGGSSALNALSYHRATSGTYQKWAELAGDESFTFENLLPYYKKSCHLTPPDVSIGLPVSSTGFSSGSLSGHGAWVPSTIEPENAIRSSSQSSFLEEAIENTNIMVHTHTQALKILFASGSPKRANAVQVSTSGFQYTIHAKKEVIISAGVFHSPQLLMVSGIGPRPVLEKQNVPLISELPGVGQNLWDQVSFTVLNQVDTPSAGSIVANPNKSAEILQQYYDDADGPYSSAAGYLSFERIPKELRENFSQQTTSSLKYFPFDWPEAEYVGAGFGGDNFSTIGVFGGVLTAPLSRGNVTINSSSMLDPPVIDLAWFSDPADSEVAVAIFKRIRQIWDSDPAKSIKIGSEILPGVAVQTDEEILKYIQENSAPMWHASATCAMGKPGDVNAVVDSRGRVFGVEGLRVVDASIFPFALPGHPQASVYMIGEKIADDIMTWK
ncbi:choline dehydrogenase [Botrytis cinerea]